MKTFLQGQNFTVNQPVKTQPTTKAFNLIKRLITLMLIFSAVLAYGQTYTTSTTYTVPAGVHTIQVECWGGGGAGGGATGNPAAGGGGAGGAYAKAFITVTPGTTYTVTVGGVKTATTTSTATTNNGNPSWFGTVSTVYAAGGAGGAPAGTNSSNGVAGAGTTAGSIGSAQLYAGGSGSLGSYTTLVPGGAGGGGAGSTGNGGSALLAVGGLGGSQNGGNGAAGVANSTAGAAGNNYGAGGSGAKANTNTDQAGGSGAAGLVVVTAISPSNDDCAYASTLTVGGSATTGNIANSSSSAAACAGADAYDVYYKFTPTCNGNHTITVDPSNFFDAVFQVYSTCGGSAINPTSGSSCVNSGTNNGNESATYNLTAGTTYYVRVYDYNNSASGFPSTTDFTIQVTGPALPTTANAGSDQSSVCGVTTAILAANSPSNGTGAWSIISGTGGSFLSTSNPLTTFSGVSGTTYTLRWTIDNGSCPISTDDVIITFNAIPVSNAGPDQTLCGATSATLAGTMNAGTGAWTKISGTGGSFGTSNSPTSTFTGTAGQTYTLRWTVTSPACGTATDDVIISFPINPVLVITNPSAVCSNSSGVNLTSAAVTVGSTGGGTLSYWTNAGGTTPLSNPSAVLTSGTYYIKSTTSAGCTDIDPVTATVTTLPVATFSYTGSPYCKNVSNPSPTYSGGGAAGTFSSTAGLSFVSTSTGQINLTSSTANTYTVTNTRAAAGGCPVVTATSNITITTPPSATIAYSSALFCTSVASATMTRTGTSGGTYSAPAGLTISASTGDIIPSTSTPGTYTVTYTVAASGGCPVYTTTTSVQIVAIPVVTITTDYCNPGAGQVKLTASSGSSYLWSTGATTQIYTADEAGTYTVTVTNASGCQGSSFVNVAQELVTNGNFESGVVGITSLYTNQQGLYDGSSGSGLYPEGLYAVNTNANSYHNYFFGPDHTSGSGKYMMVNGSGASIPPVVWQQTVNIQPNTTYYFSAWTRSLNDVAPYAKLRFAVDDVQVGTIAVLTAGANSTAGPFNWVRFYGTWTSGATATTAEVSILDIETALGGNDFGIDDISFGTMSPVPYIVAPSAGPGGNTVCEGSPVTLYANREGGMSPFTYSWTGPNGFTATTENPSLTLSATSAHGGTYSVSVLDGQTCTTSGSFVLTVNPLPTNLTPTASPATICSSSSTNIQIASSQSGVSYQLRNNADNSLVGSAVAGTGSTISLPTGTLTANTTYNVLATNTTTGCSRVLSATPTVTIATTPNLVITNQAKCSGTVNLTAAAVTAGSTNVGTLTYWTNAACTTAVSTPSAVGAGTYYIKATNASCTDVEPVVVSISTTPVATFNYTGSPFCASGTNPLPVYSGGGVAGVFSSSTGAVFVSTATGEVNLAATPAGTHTITNTITPSGGCSAVTYSRTIVVTAVPVADFNYGSTIICQNASAANPNPVFISGGSAGTFSSSYGLSFVSTTTGQINLSASTPGNYAVTNTKAASGGCSAVSYTSYILINPYTFSGGVVSAASASTICGGQTLNLTSQTPVYLSSALEENFNSTTNTWVTTNTSSGGTPASAAFTLTANGTVYDALTFNSNDNTQYYISSSKAQGSGGTTATTLRSPSFSTVGFSTLSLDFFQYFRYASSGDVAKVQVSTDSYNWIDVASYSATQGASNSFTNSVVNLDDYVGLSNLYVRFKYDATNDKYWAIDNVSVTGYSSNYSYSWASSPVGFISTAQNPTGAAPTTTTSYTVTATNVYGCSASSSATSVTVTPSPSLSSTLTPTAICSNTAFTYTPTSATSGVTITWTRAAVTGISNAAVTTPQSTTINETLINTTTAPIDVVYSITTAKSGCSTTQSVTVKVYAPNVWNGSQSTNWFTGMNWCINGANIPNTTTTALIPDIAITTRNPVIDNAQGTGATTKNLTIMSGGGLTINGSAALTMWGTWDNSGTFTAGSSTVTFKGTATDSIKGSGNQQFYNLTLDKGTDTTTVLVGKINVGVSNTFTMTNGMYNQYTNTLSVTNGVTVSNKSAIDVTNGGTVTIGGNVTNNGLLRVTLGTINIGTTTSHSLTNASGSRFRVTNGKLTIAGTVTNNSATNRINGGTFEVGGAWINTGTSSLIQTGGTITLNKGIISNNSNSIFDVASTSSISFTAGDIIIQDANAGTGGDIKITAGLGSKSIAAAHNMQVGNSATLSTSTFKINGGTTQLGKLTINNSDALIARLTGTTTVTTLALNRPVELNANTLVIANTATTAITGTSYIISETTNGNSKIQWNIGNSTGSYRFPFGNALGATLPFTFQVTTAGTQLTGGNMTIATYPTDDNNLPLVTGVLNMLTENGTGGAQSTIDRWWIIDANNYLTKPTSSMSFGYADVDLVGNSLLTEANLKAQRWDMSILHGLSAPGGWNPSDFFGGLNLGNIVNNAVTVTNVTNYSPWTLSDGSSPGNAPLPIELVDFSAACNSDVVTINWTTATETNNNYFSIQRSADLVAFDDIGVVEGAGNSNAPLHYTFNDDFPISGKNVYYRLMQTDFNGEFEIFNPVATMCVTKSSDVITIYPNPATDVLNIRMDVGSADRGVINVYNSLGQVVKTLMVEPSQGQNLYTVEVGDLSHGQYFVSFSMDNKNYPVQKLMVTR